LLQFPEKLFLGDLQLKVLVAFASKHGSTEGIADFMGEKLHEKGVIADVLDVSKVRNPESFDAYVLGSALYMGHWMKEAKEFARRNKAILSARPVWLFSSGPTGTEKKNAKGQDLLDPKVSGPLELSELRKEMNVRDHRIFFGAFDANNMGFFMRQMLRSATIRESVPQGDFRDWKDIEAWIDMIMRELSEIPITNKAS
jgi:menaquinone-dependent protoporphyrinogen oxidase